MACLICTKIRLKIHEMKPNLDNLAFCNDYPAIMLALTAYRKRFFLKNAIWLLQKCKYRCIILPLSDWAPAQDKEETL